jgi:hypothetical protein
VSLCRLGHGMQRMQLLFDLSVVAGSGQGIPGARRWKCELRW